MTSNSAGGFDWPEQWHNDDDMGALMEPLPETEAVDREHWRQKMDFWTRLIADTQRHPAFGGRLSFSFAELKARFTRDGLAPKCLERVLRELCAHNVIAPVQSLLAPPQKRGVGSLLASAASYLTSFVWTPKTPNLPADMRFAFVEHVKTEADRLYRLVSTQCERVGHGGAVIDFVVPYAQLLHDPNIANALLHRTVLSQPAPAPAALGKAAEPAAAANAATAHAAAATVNADDLELLFRQLCLEGRAVDSAAAAAPGGAGAAKPQGTTAAAAAAAGAAPHGVPTQRVVKFLRPGAREKLQPLTAFEHSVGELKLVLARAAQDISALEVQIEAKTADAKALLQAKKRDQAKGVLARRKALQALVHRRREMHGNMEALLDRMVGMAVDKHALDVMATGAASLRRQQHDWKLDAAAVADTMDQWADLMGQTDAVSAAVAEPMQLDTAADADLEREYEALEKSLAAANAPSAVAAAAAPAVTAVNAVTAAHTPSKPAVAVAAAAASTAAATTPARPLAPVTAASMPAAAAAAPVAAPRSAAKAAPKTLLLS